MKYGKDGRIKKALVIGASGFAGRHLVGELAGRGVEILAVEHSKPLADQINTRAIRGGIKAVNHKLIDETRPDIIFHLARPAFPRFRKAGRILAGHYAAFLNRRLIRELERSLHKPRLVFASGSLMYGPSPLPANENSPLKPFSYARQYYRGEMPLLKAIQADKYPFHIMRLPWLLGNGSWFEWFYMRTMASHRAIPLFGAGDNLMELIDVTDAVKLMIEIAAHADAPPVCNIVSQGAMTQLEFAQALSTFSGYSVKDYREIFGDRLERETIEAFTSGIILDTKYPQFFRDFEYTRIEDSLFRIIKGADGFPLTRE